MPRRDEQRLADILDALDWVARAIVGKDSRDFLGDELLRYAVAQRLIVVGEAAARLSPEVRANRSAVAWADVVAFRNLLVHEYFGIDWLVVWQTATVEGPKLRSEIAKMAAED